MNLDQYAKNQDFLSFCSRDIVNFKILQSDWSRAFWRISQNQIFPKYGIYARIQQIIQTFFIDQIQKKMSPSQEKFRTEGRKDGWRDPNS